MVPGPRAALPSGMRLGVLEGSENRLRGAEREAGAHRGALSAGKGRAGLGKRLGTGGPLPSLTRPLTGATARPRPAVSCGVSAETSVGQCVASQGLTLSSLLSQVTFLLGRRL